MSRCSYSSGGPTESGDCVYSAGRESVCFKGFMKVHLDYLSLELLLSRFLVNLGRASFGLVKHYRVGLEGF